MFIAAIITIASTLQPKCPSTEEWIKKMWCIYTMEYYSAIKKNEDNLCEVIRRDFHRYWDVKKAKHKRAFTVTLCLRKKRKQNT